MTLDPLRWENVNEDSDELGITEITPIYHWLGS